MITASTMKELSASVSLTIDWFLYEGNTGT